MNNIIVEYKYKTREGFNDDLICSLTRFMDLYLIGFRESSMFKTYIYNDLNKYSKNEMNVAIRVPGATRGHIELERVDKNKFLIKGFDFYDSCEGPFACYDPKIKEDVKAL